MSDHKPENGIPPRSVYDEELNFQPTPGWQPPSDKKQNLLSVPLSYVAATGSATWRTLSFGSRPLLTRPMSIRSVTGDGLRLVGKTLAWGAIIAVPAVTPFVVDHYTGAISSTVYPPIAQGKFGSREVTSEPPAKGPIDVERCYDQVASWREYLRADGYVVTEQQPLPASAYWPL